jgi:tRNA nucleotidyltransferase (CCA-adding enzyme)
MADYIYMMGSRLTPDQQRAVSAVEEIARTHEMNLYLSGGTIRDIISGFPIRDLDLTVQGNVFKFQKDLEKAGAVIQSVDESLRSLFVLFPGNIRAEISATRSEIYPKPSKPEITFGTINEDLRRRDFTVNAMALSLHPASRGLLLDPFNGIADIEAKLIRILHNYSFFEEPSRLIRTTRFAARFHWTLEERTQARYDAAKENNYIESISNRGIGYEIEQIAHEDDPIAVMKALEKEGWLKVLYPAWTPAKVDTANLSQLMKTRQQLADLNISADPGAPVMYFLTSKLPEKDISAIQRLIPNKGFVEQWKNVEDDAKELAKRLTSKEAATPSQTWQLLMASRPETIMFLDVTTRHSGVEQKIKNFLTKWPQYRQKIPLQIMQEMRITPDLPDYSKLTEQMFLMMLDSKLRSESEIRKFLQPFSPPEPVAPPPPPRRGRAKKAAKVEAGATAGAAAEQKKPAKAAKAKAADAPEAAAAAVGNQAGKIVKAVAGETAPAARPQKDGLPKAERVAPAKATGKAKPAQAKPKAQAKPARKPKPVARPKLKAKTGKTAKKPAARKR